MPIQGKEVYSPTVKQVTEDLTEATKKYIAELEKVAQFGGKITGAKGIKDLKTATDNLNKSTEKLAQDQKELTDLMSREAKTISEARKQNIQLRKARGDVIATTKEGTIKIKELNKQINRNNKLVKKNVDELTKQKIGIGKYAKGMQTALVKVGLFAVGIKTLIKGLGKLIGISSGFESQMDKVQAITNASTKEINALKASAKDLGSRTTKTAREVGTLQEELSKLGFTTKELLAGTGGILSLSEATGSDLAQAAKVAGSTIRGFGKNASETDHIVDVMAKSFSTSALNIQKYEVAMANAQIAAKATGKTLEQTTAMLAKIVDTGTDASKAGTDLRVIFGKLAKQGISLNDAYDMVNTSGNKVVTAMGLVGDRAYSSLITLSQNRDEVDALTKSYENSAGTAEKMAAIMRDNLAGDITIAKSAWEGLVLSVEDGSGGINKAFRFVIQTFTKFVNSITKNDIIKELQAEQIEVNSLTLKLGDLNLPLDKRNEYYEELKKLQPSIIKGINKENISTEKLYKNLQNYNKEIANKILLTGLEEKEQKLLDKQLKKTIKVQQDQADIIVETSRILSSENATEKMQELATSYISAVSENDFTKMKESYKLLSKEIINTGGAVKQALLGGDMGNYYRALVLSNSALANMIEKNGDVLAGIQARKKAIELLLKNEEEAKEEAKEEDEVSKNRENEKIESIERLKLAEVELRKTQKEQLADISKQREEEQKKYLDFIDAKINAEEKLGEIKKETAYAAFDFTNALLSRDLELTKEKIESKELSEKEGAKKIAEIQRKQAILNKTIALGEIAINTAIGVSAIARTGGGTYYADFGISAGVLTALTIAKGLLQAGVVLAQPLPEIPSFFEGGKGKGIAEIHGQEIVNTDHGSFFTNWDKYQGKIMDLPKFEVIPNDQIIQSDINNIVKSGSDISLQGGISKDEFERISQNQTNEFKRAISNMPQPIITKDGSLKSVIIGQSKVNFLNKINV